MLCLWFYLVLFSLLIRPLKIQWTGVAASRVAEVLTAGAGMS